VGNNFGGLNFGFPIVLRENIVWGEKLGGNYFRSWGKTFFGINFLGEQQVFDYKILQDKQNCE
jgi:hypothetical protein